MVSLGRKRAEEVVLVCVGRPGDRELAGDPARVVEHRRQRDPARLRHPGGEQGGQPRLGAGPAHPILGVVRDLRHPDSLADRRDLLRDALPGVRAAEGHVLLRGEAGLLEPEGVLQAERGAPDGVRGRQSVVDRGGQEWPGSRQLLVRECDLKPPPVILLDLRIRVAECRVVAEPGDVHRPDIHPGIGLVTGRHPGRQGEADAAALGQPGHDAARNPVAT